MSASRYGKRAASAARSNDSVRSPSASRISWLRSAYVLARSGVTARLAMFIPPQRISARVPVRASKSPHRRKASWARRV